MLAKMMTAACSGIEGKKVTVEVDITRGLPGLYVVGLGDLAIKEAGQRVKSAIRNSGFEYPLHRIVVNLVPAYIHKKGSHYDLAMAMGILKAGGELDFAGEDFGFIGELCLDGSLSPVRGVLPMVQALAGEVKQIFLPKGNYKEGLLAQAACQVRLIPVESLREVAELLGGREPSRRAALSESPSSESLSLELLSETLSEESVPEETLDFVDVKGQWAAKEAIAVAVCGNHALLMVGPPGAGKTMLARRIPTILPPMSAREQMETTMIYSVAGLLSEERPVVRRRPFCTADYRTTRVGLLGGGNVPYPGQVSLAHNGVLFIDEFLEMESGRLDALRKPMEEECVQLVRRGQVYTFPSRFMLVGAANPCRCGYYGDKHHPCTCTRTQIDQYQSRLSGPMADRIDMFIQVYPVEFEELRGEEQGTSARLREMVLKGRAMQEKRFYGSGISFNSQMEEGHMERHCPMGPEEIRFLKDTCDRYHLSSRRYYKLLRVARTVADMAGRPELTMYDLAAAFRYVMFSYGTISKGE